MVEPPAGAGGVGVDGASVAGFEAGAGAAGGAGVCVILDAGVEGGWADDELVAPGAGGGAGLGCIHYQPEVDRE